MPTWTALSPSQHQALAFRRFADYHFAQMDSFAPVLAAELSEASAYYPLAFIAQGEAFQLVAVQSLQPGLNLYVGPQGQWQAPYVPSCYRSHPFRLLPKPDDESQQILCFDADSSLIDEDNSNLDSLAVFDREGQPSETLQPIIDFLQQRHNNQQLTDRVVASLARHGLIQPWPIKAQTDEEADSKAIEGLYHIDEERLKALAPAALSELTASGALGLAYAQLLSQARLKDFAVRYRQHDEYAKQQSSQMTDLDELFGENNETLSFN